MKTSAFGRKLIEHYEGFEPKVYNDGVGVMTIGYGHALKRGESFPNGVTREEASAILSKDLANTEAAVLRLVKAKINQNQFDALVAFVFNIGAGNFQSSTLLRLLNASDYKGAESQFLRWNKGRVKGKLVELRGLTRRRRAESKLFSLGSGVTNPEQFVVLD